MEGSEMSDRTTICGISDLLLLARVKDPDFNLSDFTRKALEFYLFEEEFGNPRQEAAIRAADAILKEKKQQKRIVEETQTYEEKARELVESRKRVFSREAQAFFRNPVIFERKLPEYDAHGDYLKTWEEIADRLTSRCGFAITVDECMSYIRAGGIA